MAKLAIKKASTDVTVYLFIQDSSKTTGEGLTGLAYNTASLVASYVRPLGSRAAITLATQTVDGAHSDGGFVEVDATNMPGVYRLDLPDAVCATGVPSVVVMLKGATNMSPVVLEIQLTDFDLNTAFTSALVADAVLDEATSGHTSAGSFSKAVTDILADTGTDGVKIASGELSTVATASSITALDGKIDTIDNFLDTEVAAILADTNEVQTELADGGRTDLLIDAIKAKTDTIPASPAPANEYDARMTAIQADLDNPTQYKADVSGLATQVSVNAIPTSPLLAANYVAPDNASVGAIKTKTDQLVFTTPNKVDASATIDPTGLATSAALATVDGIVDDIKAKTDQLVFTTPNRVDASATVDPTGIATSAELEAVDDKVDAIKAKTDQLDVSSTSFVTAVSGSTITILRGDTLSAALLNLGSLASYVSLDFTVKKNAYQTDDEATIRIRKNASGTGDGLLRLNEAAHSVGTDGTITIDDAPTGDITITLKAGVTDDLLPGNYVYDVQLIEAAEVSTLTTGTLVVTADVTRLVA